MAVTPIIRYVNTDNTVSGDGTTNETDGSADSAYTSLNVALQNEKADLVSISSSLTILCSGTTIDSGSNGFVMTVPQDTWYTSEECNVTIKTPPDQRHNGVWDDTKYRLYAFSSLSGSIGNIVLDGLQIRNNPTTQNSRPIALQSVTAVSGQRVNVVKNCLLMVGRDSAGISPATMVYIARNGVPIYFYNNILYVSASSQQTDNTNRAFYSDGSNTVYFYNNTVVGNGKLNYGFDTGGPNYLKNNIFTGTTVESYLGTPTTDEYNATSDGDATGTGARTNQTFSFINPSIDDYRLSSKDKGAARFGADVSNDTNLTQYSQSYTTDITGTTRTTPWEIGAYQLPYDEGAVSVKPSPELITNGGFDTDSDWTKLTGWTISGGVAVCDGTNSADLRQFPILTPGNTYRMKFEITALVAGAVRPRIGGQNGTDRNSVGTYTENIVAGTTVNRIDLRSVNFSGSIDNVSVKEIPPIQSTGKPFKIS